LSVLRSSIGYVPQETFLFSETVAENIAFESKTPLQTKLNEQQPKQELLRILKNSLKASRRWSASEESRFQEDRSSEQQSLARCYAGRAF
jgi:ABC-type phosphate transport system ATPase subunit